MPTLTQVFSTLAKKGYTNELKGFSWSGFWDMIQDKSNPFEVTSNRRLHSVIGKGIQIPRNFPNAQYGKFVVVRHYSSLYFLADAETAKDARAWKRERTTKRRDSVRGPLESAYAKADSYYQERGPFTAAELLASVGGGKVSVDLVRSYAGQLRKQLEQSGKWKIKWVPDTSAHIFYK